MPRERVMVVDDEPDIRDILQHALQREGFDVLAVADGTAALAAVRSRPPNLVLLDLMLPGVGGLEVCRRLRAEPATATLPIIMVSAKGEEPDVVLGLGLGADDYVTKPFRSHELVARVKAVLRRAREEAAGGSEQSAVSAGPLLIDPVRHRVEVGGEALDFTATEFRILHHLARRPGRVYTREQILRAALGSQTIVLDRTVDAHVRSIRSKLGEHRDLVETVRAVGYRFRESAR